MPSGFGFRDLNHRAANELNTTLAIFFERVFFEGRSQIFFRLR